MRVGVWVLGSDRPGIVAAITGALAECGGNLADTAMTILSGQFAMVLIVDAVHDVHQLERAVHDAGAACNVITNVAPIADISDGDIAGMQYIVSVYGADHPGIVHAVATALANASVNITDVRTHVTGDAAALVYTMILEVVLPSGLDPESVRTALAACAQALAVEAHMHPVQADVL
ncbi:MAG: glycine cleavage system protein R [Acidimicrobiia bacterium]